MTTRSVKRPERVAVIGVGIVGASVGWNLSRHGAEVVLIDAGRPGEGVTNWSFSWVNASNKTERRSYFDLNVAGMAACRELAEVIGPDSWWYPDGHLRWAGDPAAEAKLLQTAELLVAWDYRVEVRTGAGVRRSLEPALEVPGQVPVVFYPDEAWVHGRHLVGRLVGQAVGAGAVCRFGIAVSGIGIGADASIKTVALSDGSSLDVDVVVNAGGPDASQVAGLIARHLPELGRLLHESARRVVPELGNSRIAAARVADRPIPGDGFPSVGAVPSAPGYYEAVSHSAITLGPVIGRLLTSEILGGRTDGMLADFRPERFPQ